MFFIFSKILLFLLSPFWWLLILILLISFTKRKELKRKFTLLTVLIALLFSNSFLYQSVVNAYQPTRANLGDQKFSAAILLCGMGGFDTDGNFNFGFAADRFIQTEKLYHAGIVHKIIVTGGVGSLNISKEPDEASFIKKELILSGVKEEDILIETKSRNTFENAIFTKLIVDSLNLKAPFLLVTSAMHMPRASAVFKKVNIKTIDFPCNYVGYKSVHDISYYFPDPELLTKWQMILKEMIGYYAYKFSGKI